MSEQTQQVELLITRAGINELIATLCKNPKYAISYAFLLGPLGMFYSGMLPGLISVGIGGIILYFHSTLFHAWILIILWILSPLVSAIIVVKKNEKIINQIESAIATHDEILLQYKNKEEAS